MFVALEGGEGVGKTTQWQRLGASLAEAGHVVVSLREPGGTPAGDVIRKVLLHATTDLASEAEALLFAASRAQLVRRVIAPALARDAIVLVDRFLLSTYAYQGAGRRLSLRALRVTNALATGGIAPDITLLLTMPLDAALARMRARGTVDRLEGESLEFHRRVNAAFHRALAPSWQRRYPDVGPVFAIPASGTPEVVTARCLERLAECFPARFAGGPHG